MSNIWLTIIFFMTTGLASISFAEDSGGYANIFYGLSVPDSANTSMHAVYGFTGGSRVTEKISLGGYHTVSSTESATGSVPFSYSLTGLEARINLASGDTNVYVGLRAGITKVNTIDSGNDVIFSPYHVGIVSGYNVRFWSKMSIGFEGSYIDIEASKTSSGANSIEHQAFHTINFFGTIGVLF